ncbi:MAG: DUF2914 domain-containing protein [Myxococcota bacterium]|jgi:hypothetical protein|nr:DUF2914 domain-containing protein [Myxococcota bacterium]
MTKRSSILSNVSSSTRALGLMGLLLALGCGDAESNEGTVSAAATSATTPSTYAPERAPTTPSALPTAVVAPSEVPSSTLTAPSRPSMESGSSSTASTPELRTAEGVTLRRLALTRRIEGREPVMPGTTFAASSERLYAFVEASSTADDARELVVSFFGPGHRHTGVVTLTIPADAPRWRTWAYTAHANEPGAWTAEIRTKDGALVGRQRFVIE